MASKKILLVEDDPDIRMLLKKHLEHCGYQCACVDEAETALSLLNEMRPDLVVLDLGLKEANGTAFLKHAGNWLPKGTTPPPVIVISGHGHREVIEYCLEQGARDFLRKPLELERFTQVVRHQLQ